jgi:uncharacterized membrane protein
MKDFFSKLLTGMSIGIVCALIPNALLGEILKLLIPRFSGLQHLLDYRYSHELVARYDWCNGRYHF